MTKQSKDLPNVINRKEFALNTQLRKDYQKLTEFYKENRESLSCSDIQALYQLARMDRKNKRYDRFLYVSGRLYVDKDTILYKDTKYSKEFKELYYELLKIYDNDWNLAQAIKKKTPDFNAKAFYMYIRKFLLSRVSTVRKYLEILKNFKKELENEN